MTRLFILLACPSVLLGGCLLLGPGADDDEDDDDTEGGSSLGPGIVSPGPMAGSGAPANVTGWSCYESRTECSCNRYSFSTSEDGRCRYDWSCCVHTPASNTCRCFSDDSCAAVVASMQGTELVQTCPPNAALVPEACAPANENCTHDYLDERGLHGCCDGLVCKVNDQGVRVCQPGSEAEQAAEAQCLDERVEGLVVAGPLPTSAGALPFTIAGSLLPDITASGCPLQLPLSLSAAGDVVSSAFCSLRLTAGPDRDADGRLIVHDLQLMAEGLGGPCAGFPAGVRGLYTEGVAMAGTLAFEGASCDGSGAQICIAGRMVLTLDATLPGSSAVSPDAEPVDVTFAGASVELSGRICDSSPSMTACPAQP